RSCGGSTWRRLPCWCAHGIAIRSRNQIKSTENVALHFRENPTSHKAKSRTYATSTRANCRRSVLGQQVVVEYVTGAGGTIGSNRVAKAAPDGYQFLLGHVGTHAFSQTLYKKPPYDAMTEFAPVGLVYHGLFVLLARKDLPVSTLAEFIAYAKTNRDTMQFGSAGAGAISHMACVLLNISM